MSNLEPHPTTRERKNLRSCWICSPAALDGLANGLANDNEVQVVEGAARSKKVVVFLMIDIALRPICYAEK
jgi:hypothetical protein